MLSHVVLSNGFWAHVLMTTMHLINRSLDRAIDCGIPKEIWNVKKPSYGHLISCEAYVHVPKEIRKKLDPESKICIFMGYGTSSEMGYCSMGS